METRSEARSAEQRHRSAAPKTRSAARLDKSGAEVGDFCHRKLVVRRQRVDLGDRKGGGALFYSVSPASVAAGGQDDGDNDEGSSEWAAAELHGPPDVHPGKPQTTKY